MYILIHIENCEASFVSIEQNFLKARYARERLIQTGLYRTGLLTWIKTNDILYDLAHSMKENGYTQDRYDVFLKALPKNKKDEFEYILKTI